MTYILIACILLCAYKAIVLWSEHDIPFALSLAAMAIGGMIGAEIVLTILRVIFGADAVYDAIWS